MLLSPPKDSKEYLVESKVLMTSVKKIASSLDYEITLRSNGISFIVWLSLDAAIGDQKECQNNKHCFWCQGLGRLFLKLVKEGNVTDRQ